jgi:hypothetical protein
VQGDGICLDRRRNQRAGLGFSREISGRRSLPPLNLLSLFSSVTVEPVLGGRVYTMRQIPTFVKG